MERSHDDVMFFEKLYQRVGDLLEQAQSYIKTKSTQDIQFLSMEDAVLTMTEITRITTRLAHIVTWLSLQRAIAKGEITIAEAKEDHYHVVDTVLISEDSADTSANLPSKVRELLLETRELYLQIAHMDDQFRQTISHLN